MHKPHYRTEAERSAGQKAERRLCHQMGVAYTVVFTLIGGGYGVLAGAVLWLMTYLIVRDLQKHEGLER